MGKGWWWAFILEGFDGDESAMALGRLIVTQPIFRKQLGAVLPRGAGATFAGVIRTTW